MEARKPDHTETSRLQLLSYSIASWVFAALGFLTLALGLLGLNVPHFPLLAFLFLGLAILMRILNDLRAPTSQPEHTD